MSYCVGESHGPSVLLVLFATIVRHAQRRHACVNATSLPRIWCFACIMRCLRHASQIIKELIRAGAKMDPRDCEGRAAIHYAADMGHLPALRELMKAGSSHAWRENTFRTPLALACVKGHIACAKYLLEECNADPKEGGNIRTTPLAIAAHRGHLEIVKMLLRFGARQLGPYAYNDALCGVAMNGNVKMMRELLSADAGVHVNDIKVNNDRTLLHCAAGHCHPLVTSMILAAGGDETALDSGRKTPFDIVDTLSHQHVRNGLEQRRVRRMLTQAPAYRARSWGWPRVSVPRAPSPSPTPNPAKPATGIAAGEAGAVERSVKRATEAVEKMAEDLNRPCDEAIAATTAGAGKVCVALFRRSAISSSSRSAADGHSVVVASMIRYVV